MDTAAPFADFLDRRRKELPLHRGIEGARARCRALNAEASLVFEEFRRQPSDAAHMRWRLLEARVGAAYAEIKAYRKELAEYRAGAWRFATEG